MLKMVVYLGFGAVVFAMAAAGSWYLQKSSSEKQTDQSMAGADEDTSTPISSSEQPSSQKPSEGSELPVPVRPRAMSAEEVFRYAASIRTRTELLQKREESLEKDRVRLKLVFDDIRGEQRELEGLQAQIDAKIQAAENLLDHVIRERERSAKEREDAKQDIEDLKKAQIEYEALEIDNLKKMSRVFQNMKSEKAAEYMRELANDGKISLVVKLLANLEEREASKILEAMDDATLVVQLIDKSRLLKRPVVVKKKKR